MNPKPIGDIVKDKGIGGMHWRNARKYFFSGRNRAAENMKSQQLCQHVQDLCKPKSHKSQHEERS